MSANWKYRKHDEKVLDQKRHYAYLESATERTARENFKRPAYKTGGSESDGKGTEPAALDQ